MTAVRASRPSASEFVEAPGDIGPQNRADAEMAESGQDSALKMVRDRRRGVDGFHRAECRSIYSAANAVSVGPEAGRRTDLASPCSRPMKAARRRARRRHSGAVPQVRGGRCRARAIGYRTATGRARAGAGHAFSQGCGSHASTAARQTLTPQSHRWWDCGTGISARSAPRRPAQTEAATAMEAWHQTDDRPDRMTASIAARPTAEAARPARVRPPNPQPGETQIQCPSRSLSSYTEMPSRRIAAWRQNFVTEPRGTIQQPKRQTTKSNQIRVLRS